MRSPKSTQSIELTPDFSKIFPAATVGILVLDNITYQNESSKLNALKGEIISSLHKQFPGLDSLKAHPVIQAYSRYYKKFNKSYHVLGQLRSVIFEDRPLTSASPLVEAIFTAELKNMLLTAFHDLETISLPLKISISSGEETYITLNGDEKRLKIRDMMVSDREGVISSVIYGPDKRTQVTRSTSSILIVVYAPDGISRESINSHFDDIKKMIRSVSPGCKLTTRSIFPLS